MRMLKAALGAVLLAGCTVGPDFRPDRMALPGQFTEHAATPDDIARTATMMQGWWHAFGDPVLDALVARAIVGNDDLRIAGARLLESRALRDQLAGALSPQLSVGVTAGQQNFSTATEYPPGLTGVDAQSRLWSYSFNARWELDLFGRIRRTIEAQDRAVQAAEEQRRGVLVATLAELVSDYVALRSAQARLAIADRNIAAAREALDLTRRTFRQGLGTSLQVAQAQAQYETEQATRQPLEVAVAQGAHAIAVLLGEMPGSLEAQLSRPGPLPAVPPLPAALPSMVVANRPDIREAERVYAQSTARIGVAVAQLYPDVSLPLAFDPSSSMIHTLFSTNALAWNAVIDAAQPLYEGGRLKAQVREARAAAEAARLNYEKTVLTAFREVKDRLVSYQKEQARDETLHRAAQDSALALQRARRLYAAGLTGFLDVLTTERAAYAAEDLEALSTLSRLQAAIGLYTALGAGWQGVALTETTLPVPQDEQARWAKHWRPRM